MSLVENTVTIGNNGGEVTLSIKTNMTYSTIIDSGNGWITAVPATKSMRTDELRFNVEPYDGSQGEKIEGNYGNSKHETFNPVSENFITYASTDAVTESGELYSPELEGGCGVLKLRLGTHQSI